MEKADERCGKEDWGTWEELLLAFAVKRHGTASWESVSHEIQKRCSNLTPSAVTPRNCKLRFNDLKLRYDRDTDRHTDANDDASSVIPWLEDLRNRRIAELKDELERYDLSIASLQLKMKRLKEERDESFRAGDDQLDCENGVSDVKSEKLSPETMIAEPVDGDKVDQDCKSENLEVFEAKPAENDDAPVDDRDRQADAEPVCVIRSESCNGSSDSITKETLKMVKTEVDNGGPSELLALSESKKLGEIESSDVQSTTSRLRKEEINKLHSGCAGAGRENQSLFASEISQPMIEFLDILQSYKLSLVSEKLLDQQGKRYFLSYMQENSNYRNLIRQHIDIKSMYINVEGGCYSDCEHKFFRDLLLLVNNAILVFDKNSHESNLVIEIRQLISEKMSQRNSRVDLSAGKQSSAPHILLSSKQAQQQSDSLLLKPQIEGTTTVSRKRRSLDAKGSTSPSSGSDRKGVRTAALAKKKTVLESNQANQSSGAGRCGQVTKRRTRNGSSFGNRSSKKNTNQAQGKVGSSTGASQSKGAAILLDRLKESSTSNDDSFIDAWEDSLSPHPREGGKSEDKGSGGIKGGNRKNKVTPSNCEGKLLNEESSVTRRQIGRPPKRAAASTPTLVRSGKCSRAVGDSDIEAPKQAKKRSRKR